MSIKKPKPYSRKRLIESRVTAGICPICCQSMTKKDKREISFVDYNGTNQPVHKSHIKF